VRKDKPLRFHDWGSLCLVRCTSMRGSWSGDARTASHFLRLYKRIVHPDVVREIYVRHVWRHRLQRKIFIRCYLRSKFWSWSISFVFNIKKIFNLLFKLKKTKWILPLCYSLRVIRSVLCACYFLYTPRTLTATRLYPHSSEHISWSSSVR